jgi:long-chain acyl-CoA synthetase
MSSSVAAERASIERVIGGMTLVDVLERNAAAYPDEPALHWREKGGWRSLDWTGYRTAAREAAAGLVSLGVAPGDFVAIMAGNRPEHVIADLGAVLAAATPVTVYSTLAPQQIAYVAGHAQVKVAVLEDAADAARWESARQSSPSFRHVVVMEGDAVGAIRWADLLERGRRLLTETPELVDATASKVTPDSVATLIYTSGTTGTPKGVVITQRNVAWTAESVSRTLTFPDRPRVVSYLPLAHIAERMATHYCVGLWMAGEVFLVADVSGVLGAVQHVRPQLFLGVPRIWEKFQAGLLNRLESETSEPRRRIALGAVETGRQVVRREQRGERVGIWLRLRHRALDRLVLAKVRRGLGMDQLQLGITAAAPIDPGVIEFFHAVGLPLFELYGMSESCGPATTNRPGANKIGTVGQRFAGVEIALDGDGEVLIGGGVVAAGYHRDEEASGETFTADGWLRSGDLGSLDAEGFLTIIGRKKEIIITAAGKNVAPAKLEGLLKQRRLIGQACLIGEGLPYLTAILALDADEVRKRRSGASGAGLAEVAADPAVHAEIEDAVSAANQQVARVEQIKKWRLVPDEWSAETGELTPSLKLRRNVVVERYSALIDEMYG